MEYEISEDAYRCYIPRLILQPLVENALLHGIDIKRQKGKIWISGNVSEGKLILIVKDNGRGMTKEQIRDLFNSHAKKTNGLSAVGVPNVKERLELYYGTQEEWNTQAVETVRRSRYFCLRSMICLKKGEKINVQNTGGR